MPVSNCAKREADTVLTVSKRCRSDSPPTQFLPSFSDESHAFNVIKTPLSASASMIKSKELAAGVPTVTKVTPSSHYSYTGNTSILDTYSSHTKIGSPKTKTSVMERPAPTNGNCASDGAVNATPRRFPGPAGLLPKLVHKIIYICVCVCVCVCACARLCAIV